MHRPRSTLGTAGEPSSSSSQLRRRCTEQSRRPTGGRTLLYIATTHTRTHAQGCCGIIQPANRDVSVVNMSTARRNPADGTRSSDCMPSNFRRVGRTCRLQCATYRHGGYQRLNSTSSRPRTLTGARPFWQTDPAEFMSFGCLYPVCNVDWSISDVAQLAVKSSAYAVTCLTTR